MLNGAASNDDSKITRLEVKQASMETLLASETDNLKKDINTIKTDVTSMKKTLEEIRTQVVSSHGYVMGFKFALPYLIALIGIIISMSVYIGYDQQNKKHEQLEKKVESISQKVEVARDEIYRSNKGKD
jgi:outer membrane murein-binding lipoprotein Lpp